MSFRYNNIEGKGEEALWYGETSTDFPDFELREQSGAVQNRVHCHSGDVDISGSLDGVNFYNIVSLSEGQATFIASRPLYIRCTPTSTKYVTVSLSSFYVNRYRKRINPKSVYNQPIDVGGLYGLDWGLSNLYTNSIGAWYDPSDTTTLFQDAAGTIPVTGAGDPVGLILDKSQGLVLGPELVTNGTFDTGDLTGWSIGGADGASITWNGGQADIVGNSYLSQQITGLTAGSVYRITASVTETNSQGSIRIGTTENNGDIYDSPTFSSSVDYELFIVPPGSGFWVTIKNEASVGVTSDYSFWDNISVRELPGHHAFQDTNNDFRPTLARHPATGLRNLLDASEDLSIWDTNGTVTRTFNAVADQNFAQTMTQLDCGGQNFGLYELINNPTGVSSYTYTVDVKYVSGATENAKVRFEGTSLAASSGIVVNVNTGAFVGYSGSAPDNYTITQLGNGVYRVSVSVTTVGTGQLAGVLYANDGAMVFAARRAQIEESTSATNYQKRVNQYDVTEAGQRDLWYLDFDGVDDYLETAAIDFTATDKMSVFAGVHIRATSGAPTLLESSSNIDTNNGSISLRAPWVGVGDFVGRSKGTLTAFAADVTDDRPREAIVSFLSEISTDTAILRVDGVQKASSGGDQGAGNYGNHKIYIGMRGGVDLSWPGRLYGLAIAGKACTDAEIAGTEAYLANKSEVIL